jgi:hypothetical protein
MPPLRLDAQPHRYKVFQAETIPAPRYIERNIDRTLDSDKSPVQLARPLSASGNGLGLLLSDARIKSSNKPQYHIRVKGTSPLAFNANNFLYLAMLVEKLDYLVGKKTASQRGRQYAELNRLSVFLMPDVNVDFFPFGCNGSGDTQPDKDFSQQTAQIVYDKYLFASRYLRLIAKANTGVIYGLYHEKGVPNILPLNFKCPFPSFETSAAFPIIPVNGVYYTVLFDTLFSEGVPWENNIFTSPKIPNALDSDIHKALKPYILDFCVRYLKYFAEKFEDSEEVLVEIANFILRTEEHDVGERHFSSLKLALFSVMLDREQHDDYKTLKGESLELAFVLASDLENGLRQIIQNSIQHSELNSCILSFRLAREPGSGRRNALEIVLADWNETETIADNFVKNIKKEKTLIKQFDDGADVLLFDELINSQKQLALRDFFGDYQDETNRLWFDFRQADTSAHIGLAIFSNIMEKCGAIFRVKNSIVYETMEENIYEPVTTQTPFPLNHLRKS